MLNPLLAPRSVIEVEPMTQRKRAVHFALMDTAFAADRKFVRLAHKAPNPADYAAAVGVFWLILADCRRSKSPEVAWTEYEEYEPQLALLKEVGLLNGTGFPEGPFDKWAPVYKSPWDVNRGTAGDAEVRNGTHRDDVSVQLDSVQLPSNGVGGPGEGDEPPPRTFMRSPRGPRADAADVRRQDEEAWSKCAECGELGRKHPASGDHPFRPEKLRAVK